ncbi:MAG: aldehyde dehydrogenase family protein, partial [Nocardioidaceae bacterium]|nr:aldehyde dehydrogenase family protein [Nocardioidaceae bacterium]
MGDFTLEQIADLPLDLLIGGVPVAASDGGRFDVVDPATGAVVASVADGTVEDAAAAVDAAAAAAAG